MYTHSHMHSLSVSGKLSCVGRLRPTACGCTLEKGRRGVSLCCLVSVLPLHFSQHHFPSVYVCHSIWNSSGLPVSWFDKNRLYVFKAVWLFSRFLYDSGTLSYTQHKAAHSTASCIASVRPRELPFSRQAPTFSKCLFPPVPTCTSLGMLSCNIGTLLFWGSRK